MSVALDGSVRAVGRLSDESPRDPSGMFAKSQLDRPSDYVIACWREGRLETTVLREESVAVHFAQPLSEGTLVVGARCKWREAGPEQNALVVDAAGNVVRRMTLGDGIQDVRTSPDDRIWASYFDEGVFGNYGWARPGSPPIGAPGLVCFDAEGRIVTSFDSDAAGTDRICDAYATNVVADDDVWICFYTTFPIVRLHAGRYSVWRSDARGPNALVVDESRAMLVGSYEHRARVEVLELGPGGRTRSRGEHELIDEDGGPLDRARFVGVGASLYAISGTRVRRVTEW